MKKKAKHFAKSGPYHYNKRAGAIYPKLRDLIKYKEQEIEADLDRLLLSKEAPGVVFGFLKNDKEKNLVGMPQHEEGNILVVGGNGSGKSRGIAMPTLNAWSGAICATDLKGELSEQYADLYQCGTVDRPYLIFDPTEVEGPGYDPFWWPQKDDEGNLVNNIWEIVLSIIPTKPEEHQPFWTESEQALCAAALLYFFRLGLSFSEAICEILRSASSWLCQRLSSSEDTQVKMILGNPDHLKADVLSAIDRGLRNKLMLFASDLHISHAFRGTREGARCFTWDNLEDTNVFLRIPADKVEQWGGAINLMLTQLLHYLERRPEAYSPMAKQVPQTLLLLDEFARFGKLNMLPAAMATLRSKKVNICIFVQSIAQIDAIYGVSERRIILDNCQYQAILRANDTETQEFICKLIGTRIQQHYGISYQLDDSMKNIIGYGVQVNEVRDWMVCPHELATLDVVLLLTPYGFLRVQKYPQNECIRPKQLLNRPSGTSICSNEGAKILMTEERTKNASERAQAAEHQRRTFQKQANDNKRRQEDRLKYILGGLVLKYFPELSEIVPGRTQAETQEQFQHIEALLSYLSARRDLVQQLQANASSSATSISQSINV